MKITPLGADSLGTRSFSFYIETEDLKITVDPSCALAPRRNSYPPSPLEIKKLNETYKEIRKHVLKSEIIIITHYHNDHYPFFDVEIFKDKFLLLKNYFTGMNHMQILRAKRLCDELKKLKIKFDFADKKKYKFGETQIIFSEGLWHGKAKRQGKCISFIIKDKKNSSFFSSDTQGIWEESLRNFLKKENINYFFIDGPSLYQSKRTDIDEFITDIGNILKEKPETKIIIDHHFVRDLSYKNFMGNLKKIYGNERILTCAEFSGLKDTPLEAERRNYYEGKIITFN